MGWGQFKPLLVDTAVAALEPIQTKYNELMAEKTYLESVLQKGAGQANEVALNTLTRVKNSLGLLSI